MLFLETISKFLHLQISKPLRLVASHLAVLQYKYFFMSFS